jgi:hypothetical protein
VDRSQTNSHPHVHIFLVSEEFRYKNIFQTNLISFDFHLQLFIAPYEEECGSSGWVMKRGSRSSDISEVASFVGRMSGSGRLLRYITPAILRLEERRKFD